MVEKRRGLGRGLGALISGSPSSEEDNSSQVVTAPSVATEETRSGNEPTTTSSDLGTVTSKATQSTDRRKAATKNVARSADASVSRETNSKLTTEAELSAETASPKKPETSDGAVKAKRSATSESKTTDSQNIDVSDPKTTKPRPAQSPRKSRPVDMFFTPGRANEETEEQPATRDVADRKTSTARNRRVAVPDVLGKVRAPREETEEAENGALNEKPEVPREDQATDAVAERKIPVHAGQASHADDGVSRETLVAVPGATFAEVAVESIHPNRKQPRTVFDDDDMAELVHSIREVGLLQPIVLRPSDEGGEQQYELVMGERRWRAVQEAGLSTIPAIVRETADTALLRDALLENLHRSQLNPLEEAAAYQQLMQEFDCTQDELSDRIGRSRPQISNTIRLMRLPALVQRRVAAGVLSAGHARALLGLEDVAEMERLAQRIVNEGLSVRATEEIVSMNDGLRRKTKEKSSRSTARHERLDYLANSLSDHLETNVKISLGAKKGRVSIEFGSVDDLNRIMGVIAPTAQQ